MRVCVIGLGYIGLPTAALLAHAGIPTVGCDISPEVISKISQRLFDKSEPGLSDLVQECLNSKSLGISSSPVSADVYFICVPTPVDKTSKKPDISAVIKAVTGLEKFVKSGSVIVIESTCPIGTTNKIMKLVDHWDARVDVAYCPERILPGRMLAELRCNSRILGVSEDRVHDQLLQIYSKITQGDIDRTTPEEAELIKLSENAYRDVNIGFANELNKIANEHGIDLQNVIKFANKHPRVNILSPGIGVGGHCIPVDPLFLLDSSLNCQNSVISAARKLNDSIPFKVGELAITAIQKWSGSHSGGKRIGVLGLAYKPDSSDFRDSPAVIVAEQLLVVENELLCADRYYDESVSNFGNLTIVTEQTVLDWADLIVVLVKHSHYEGLLSDWVGSILDISDGSIRFSQ